jgi:hypothetical protein
MLANMEFRSMDLPTMKNGSNIQDGSTNIAPCASGTGHVTIVKKLREQGFAMTVMGTIFQPMSTQFVGYAVAYTPPLKRLCSRITKDGILVIHFSACAVEV